MNKIERLKWIERNFGPEYVVKYFLCQRLEEIRKAINYFERRELGWGMRTDIKKQSSQAYLRPFLYKGNWDKAMKIWQKHKDRLYYIVCKNISEVNCNAVAQLISVEDAAISIEFNEKDTHCAQRNMYDHPANLQYLYVSPWRHILHNEGIVRCYRPHETSVVNRRFDVVYKLFFCGINVKEITFSVLPNKKVIIW